jgi:hypothetical protein
LLSGQAPALAGDEFGVLSINPRDTTTPIPQLPVRPTGDHLLKGGRLPPSQAPVLAGDELGVPSINPRVPTPARDDDLNATRNKAKDLNDDSLNAIPMTTMPRIDALKFGSHPVGNTFFEQRDVAKVAQASVALYAASGNVGELSMHETRMNQIRLSCMTYDNMMCFSGGPAPPSELVVLVRVARSIHKYPNSKATTATSQMSWTIKCTNTLVSQRVMTLLISVIMNAWNLIFLNPIQNKFGTAILAQDVRLTK